MSDTETFRSAARRAAYASLSKELPASTLTWAVIVIASPDAAPGGAGEGGGTRGVGGPRGSVCKAGGGGEGSGGSGFGGGGECGRGGG